MDVFTLYTTTQFNNVYPVKERTEYDVGDSKDSKTSLLSSANPYDELT